MIWRYIEVSNLHLPVAECCRGTTKLRSLHSWSAQLDLLPFNSLFRVLAALIARDSLASEFSQFQAWDFHRYHQWVSPEVIGHSFGKFQLLKSTLTVESFNPQSVSPPFYVNTFIYSSSCPKISQSLQDLITIFLPIFLPFINPISLKNKINLQPKKQD